MRLSVSRCLVAAALLLSAGVITSCGDGGRGDAGAETGRPRPFMMGISTLPRELNATAYGESFDLADDIGEIVLIQRVPPWQDFLPGTSVSDETTETTASEKDALDDGDLRLVFAIDPTDGGAGRDRLAELPPSLAGRNFADADVRAAFLAYTQYVALNYRPDYLILGVEMNLYYQKNHEDMDNFRTLYAEARDIANEASPGTLVTVSFQYEDLQGRLPTEDSHFPDWQLLDWFETDVTAISTYPSFAFSSEAEIPANYYSQLRGFTEKPIVIAEMGYASAPSALGVNNGTEPDQRAFVERALSAAEDLEMPFVIWFAGWDPAYARDTTYEVFAHIGLLKADGSEKPAFAAWSAAAHRPYTPVE